MGLWFKETIDGSQVKMSVLSSLTSCLHFESMIFFFHASRSSILMTVSVFSFFFSFHIPGSRVQKVGTMPDSPADVKTQPRSTPPTMPPPPPAVSQATNRNASFTPTTSKSSKDPFSLTATLNQLYTVTVNLLLTSSMIQNLYHKLCSCT